MWLGAEPRNLFKGLLKRSAALPLPCKQTSSFDNFTVNEEKLHKKKVHTTLLQRICTTFIDQLLTFCVLFNNNNMESIFLTSHRINLNVV